jgi:glycosyltransferase involved in cell wall biosynthesis
MKVVMACPTVERPYACFLNSVENSVPLLDAAGLDHKITFEVGNPYISAARATMLRKALDTQPDAIVFLDHDLSWKPQDLLTLIETPGDVVAGTYRFKKEEEEYMGHTDCMPNGQVAGRKDGCLKAVNVPAGFLKVTRQAINRFMAGYPELVYGEPCNPSVDLFNHGAHKGVWYGEDYAFCRNWNDLGGEIWIVPDLDLDHHSKTAVFKGNFHKYLMKQAGANDVKDAA